MSEPMIDARLCAELAREVMPLFVDRPPEVVGAVLADLVSLWVISHQMKDGTDPTDLQRETMEQFLELVLKMMAMNAKILSEPEETRQ